MSESSVERSVSGGSSKRTTRTRTTITTTSSVTPQAVSGVATAAAVTSSQSESRRSKPQTPAAAASTGGGGSQSGRRSPSPTSPLVNDRVKERAELAGLNNRLANYIDKVRHLEKENSQLLERLSVTEETITRETSRIRDHWERELNDARAMLDEVAKEKARHQIDADKYRKEATDLGSRVQKAERDAENADKRWRNAQRELEEVKARLNSALSDKNYAEDEATKLRKENAELRKQLESAKRSLEEETMKRVEYENTVLTLREELAFNKNIYDKELTEVRTRKQIEISEIDNRLAEEYDSKMADALQELREQFDADAQNMRVDIESMYKDKLDNLQRAYDSNCDDIGKYRSEAYEMRRRMETLKGDNEKDKALLKELEQRVRELEDRLSAERERFEGGLSARDDTIRALREDLNIFRDEKEQLLAENIQLTTEINAYRKLLEGEEERLHIGTPSSVKKQASSRRQTVGAVRRGTSLGGKRVLDDVTDSSALASKRSKRTVVAQSEESSQSSQALESKASATGDVQIEEVDTDGQYVRIVNKGKREVAIGNWKVTRYADDTEVTYKFHHGTKAPAGESMTLWSSSAQATHKPPKDFVMRNKTWPVADSMKTVIVNSDGEEVAEHNRSRAVHTESVFRAMGTDGAAAALAREGRENCSIM